MEKTNEKTVVLPRYVAFRSLDDAHFLRYRYEDGEFHRYLVYSETHIVSPFTKFEIEPAKKGTNLIHIRNTYSNKYWGIIGTGNGNWIGGAADAPNENESDPKCTLFEFFYRNTGSFMEVQLRHVNLNKYARTCDDEESQYFNSMSADSENPTWYIIMDYESVLVLPKYVVFKGDNGKYLHNVPYNGQNFLQFSADDVGENTAMNVVGYYTNGSLQIKSVVAGKYWNNSGDGAGWVRAGDSEPKSSFWAKKIRGNIMALKPYMTRDLFCRRISGDGVSDCLKADSASMIRETYLTVEEPVVSRSIYNVKFHLLDSRIYDETILTMATGNATNSSQTPTTVNLGLSYENSTSRIWESSLSLTLGVSFTFSTGVPLIGSAEIEISAQFSGTYTWGETQGTSKKVETNYQVTVPAMKQMKVSLLATQGRCDVPFSYVQRDTLFNGETIIEEHHDGIFRGVNCYNFTYKNEESPL